MLRPSLQAVLARTSMLLLLYRGSKPPPGGDSPCWASSSAILQQDGLLDVEPRASAADRQFCQFCPEMTNFSNKDLPAPVRRLSAEMVMPN